MVIFIIIYQLIGLFGYSLLLFSLWNSKKVKILSYRIWGNLIIAIHYLGLHAFTGFTTNLITSLRGLIYSKKETPFFHNKLWIGFFISFYLITGFITFNSLYSFLPIISAVIVSITLWNDNLFFIRLSFILEGTCWLIYAISVTSWSAIIIQSVILLSNIINFIKYEINDNKLKK